MSDESTADAAEEPAPFEMGRIGKHTLIYGLGMVLTKMVSFIMLPIYTRFLTPADYGVMELIEMTLDVIAIIGGAQIAIGVFRYYYKAETDEERSAVVSTSFVVIAASYTTIGCVIFLASGVLSDLVFDTREHAHLIQIAAASLALGGLTFTPLAFVRVQERSQLYVGVQLGKLIVQVVLNLLFLVQLDMGIRGVFMSSLLANGLVGGLLSIYLLRNVGLHFTRTATRDLLRYGIPLIGTQMATFIVTFGDRYFLQRAGGESVVGLYSLAYQFGFLVAAIGYMPFEMIWQPARFDIARRSDRDEVYARGFIYLNLLLVSISLAIALLIGDILHLMTTPAFYEAARYVPIIVVAYVLQGWSTIQDVGIHVRERTVFITLANWLAAAVALAGYAIFVPTHLAMGAAVVTVVAFSVRFLAIYAISQSLWRVEYKWGPVLRLVSVALLAYLVGSSIEVEGWWASVGVHLAVLVGYVAVALACRVLPSGDLTKGIEILRDLARSRGATT